MSILRACPTCGAELQATAKVYLSDVTVDKETGVIEDYVIAHHLGDDTTTGLCFDEADVYCANDHVLS